jgi:hypothetical protein
MASRSPQGSHRGRTNAHDSGEFHLFAAPDYDVKITTSMFVAEPVEQVGKWRTHENGGKNLLVIVHSVDVGAKPEVVVVQKLEQHFVKPVIPEDIRNRSISFAFCRILHRVFRGVWPVCAWCVAGCAARCAALAVLYYFRRNVIAPLQRSITRVV